LFLLTVLNHAQTNEVNFIFSNETQLDYIGRVGFANTNAAFYWSGTSVSINVKGTKEVKAYLNTKRDVNFCYVRID